MQRSVVRRVQSRLESHEGSALFRRAWLPSGPQRVIALVHGFAEHGARYEGLGAWFAGRGVAVHALDLRGHGLSSGPRGHAPSLITLLDDLDRFVRSVRAEHADLPCTLMGHSMGGLLSAALLARRRPDVDALVLSGPALCLRPEVGRARVTLIRALASIAPRWSFDAGIDASALSQDEAVVRRYESDPLVFRRISVALAAAVLDAQNVVAELRGSLGVPLLVVHGGDDRICSPEASRALVTRVGAAAARLRVYPKLRHELFQEPEQEDVFAHVLQWMDESRSTEGDACRPD